MNSELTISTKQENDVLIVATNGYINQNGGEKIANECFAQIDNGIRKIILDLNDSKVINSIGISILIEVIEKLNEVNGQLFFANLDPVVEKTFTIMGLFQYAQKADGINKATIE